MQAKGPGEMSPIAWEGSAAHARFLARLQGAAPPGTRPAGTAEGSPSFRQRMGYLRVL